MKNRLEIFVPLLSFTLLFYSSLFAEEKTLTVIGDEIVIKEKKITEETPSKEEVSPSQIESTSVSLFDDLSETLKTLPGVISPGDFSGELYIRGCYPWETIFLLDNVFIYWPYRWGGRLLFYNTELIKKADFYAGGYPARGNQALGGVIDVYYKEGNKEKRKIEAELSPTTLQFRIDGPIKEKLSYFSSAGRTHYDLLAKLFGIGRGMVFPYLDDLYLKLSYEPSFKDKVTLTMLRVDEGMDMKMEEGFGSPDDKEGHFWYRYAKDIIATTYNQILSPSLSHELTLSYLKDDGDFRFYSPNLPFEGNITSYDYSLRDEWTKEIGNHSLSLGGMLLRNTGDAEWKGSWKQVEEDPTTGEIATKGYSWSYLWKRTTHYWAFYLQDRIKTRLLSIEPGIRYENNDLNREEVVLPRLGLSIPTNLGQFKLVWGEYSQYPMYTDAGEDIVSRLLSQRSTQHILGWEKRIGEDKRIKIECYYNKLSNLILADKEKEYLNKGWGENQGIEFFLQKKEGGKWDGWLTYAYSKARRTVGIDKYEYLAGTTKKEDILYPTDQDRPHVASLVLNYKFRKDWKANIKLLYYSGNPYTPIVKVKEVFENGKTIYFPVYGEYLSERLPDYFKLDLTLNKRQRWGEWYLQFLNLTNHKNVYGYYYSEDYKEKKEFKMFPFMALGGVKFKF